MVTGKITDLNNLKFYSDSGVELYMEKQYVITWRLSSVDSVYCVNTPAGYVMSDVKYLEDYNSYVIDPETIFIGFSTRPEIAIPDFIDRSDRNAVSAFIRDVLCGKYIQVKKYQKKVDPVVILSIEVNGQAYSANVPVEKFFGPDFTYIDKKIAYGENDEDTENFVHLAVLDTCSTVNEPDGQPYLYKVFCGTVPVQNGNQVYYFHHAFNRVKVPEDGSVIVKGEKLPDLSETDKDYLSAHERAYLAQLSSALAQYFPYVRYSGSLMQSKTSTGFIASNTILVLEEVSKAVQNESGEVSLVKGYERPYIDDSTVWSMVFNCPEDSELKIIQTDDDYSIKQVTDAQFVLSETMLSSNNDGKVIPISFAIGVCSDQEGCYQNYLGLYLKDFRQEVNQMFFLGVITVKTEIEGEDERYRALMANFGIPDPKTYPNLFAEEDYEEQLCDWTIVNKKCKELMLIYDKIFPYAGSYKALVNALKYLGYDDIIIKEWYKIFDKNNQERDVAFDSVDLQNGKLKPLLEKYNVDYDNRKYSKLSWLSLVYHINETNETNYLDYGTPAYYVDKENNTVTPQTLFFDIPYADPIYTYRDAEIIAKLYSLKHWLETYIIGVCCRIIDITGEGIIYVPHKTQVYPTGGYLADFRNEAPLTPIVTNVSEFTESQSDITLSLSEFENATLGDYNNFTFDMFSRNEVSVPEHVLGEVTIDGQKFDVPDDFSWFSTSNTLGACVWPDELEFIVSVQPESGSLNRYTEQTGGNQVIIADNKITLLNNKTKSVRFATLPEIRLETGNIRLLKGSWEDNTVWSVRELADPEGNTVYRLRNCTVCDNTSDIEDNGHIILIPGEGATFEFSADNKWNTPMFIMSGYKVDFGNVNTDNMSDADLDAFYKMPEGVKFILEIIKGQLMLNNHNQKVSAQVDFGQHFNTEYYEHEINLTYRYMSDRVPVSYYKDDKELNEKLNALLTKKSTVTITKSQLDSFIVKSNNLGTEVVGSPAKWPKSIVNTFMADPYVRKIYTEMLYKKEADAIKSEFYRHVSELFGEYLVTNKLIDIPVNNLGDYTIQVNGYDRYNNIFNNRRFTKTNISTLPPKFDIIVNQEYSNNSADFTTRNCKGSLLNETQRKSLRPLLMDESQPNFSDSFTTYGLMADESRKETLSWWNYSYNSVSPRIGGNIILSNTRYQLKDIVLADNTLRCKLYDYNAQTKHIFNEYGEYALFGYDRTCMKHCLIAEHLKAISISETGRYADYDADLVLSGENITFDTEKLHPEHLSYYVINTAEHELALSDIQNNPGNYTSRVTLPDYYQKVFQKGDVVRVTYYATDFDYRTLVVDFSQEKNPLLHNSMFDSLYPCVFVEYIDGNTAEFQINKLSDNKDITVPDILNIKNAVLVCYSYDVKFWTVYDIIGFIRNTDKPSNILPGSLIAELVENINKDDYICPTSIVKSHAVQFDKYNDILYAKFRNNEVVTNRIYNSVSYRITDVFEHQKRGKNNIIRYYSYELNGLLDTQLIERKQDSDIYKIKTTISYPYRDLVFYQSSAAENCAESVVGYGNDYSMMLSTVEYDTDSMMLDNYIDSNFGCFISDYIPDNAYNMWYTDYEKLFSEKSALYEYHDMPLTINKLTPVVFRPCTNRQFVSESSYEWTLSSYSYDFLNGINRYEDSQLLEKMFRITNRQFSIKLDKPGPSNITLKITDPYGNRIEYEARGILLVGS